MSKYLERIKEMTPHERFVYWVKERESIRSLRVVLKRPAPWTRDPILRTYSFCNTRRMDDNVSQWIYHNWYKENKGSPNMLTACVLARHFNNPMTLEAIGFPDPWDKNRTLKILKELVDAKKTVFNGAYIITGTLGDYPAPKYQKVINLVVDPIHHKKISIPKQIDLQQLFNRLLPCTGIGSFLAGQITADARHAIASTWGDAKTWAPIGPGSKRGMNRFMGRPFKKGLQQKQFTEEFKEVSSLLAFALPEIYDRLEGIDIQNCLCEYDKYNRLLFNEGRVKKKFKKGLGLEA